MFCKHCGTQNPEDMSTCTNCGANLGTPNNAKKFDPVALFDQLRSNRYFIPAAAGLVLVVILVVLLSISGATKPITKYFSAVTKANVDKYISAFPKDYAEDWDEDDVEDKLSDNLDRWEDFYGKNVKVSCKIIDKIKYDKEDLEDLAEYLESAYDMDEDEVTAAYTVMCKVTRKGSDEKDVFYQSFVVIKYDGKWCLHPLHS